MGERKIVFYCSASSGIDPKYGLEARKAVRAICGLGITVVSGGTVKGTMGEIAEEAAACGGKHVGILPRFMKGLEHPALDETLWTDTMDQRKSLLREGTCAAVALPGGIGTLDELLGSFTDAKLKQYSGKLFALNVFGFYDPLKALLDHYVSTGMLDPESRALVSFPESVEELVALLDDVK